MKPKKTYDGAAALSKVSGLSRPEVLEIWEKVKANHAALDSCERHSFEPVSGGKLPREYRCGRCGGTVSSTDYQWYTLGLEHGRNPRPQSQSS